MKADTIIKVLTLGREKVKRGWVQRVHKKDHSVCSSYALQAAWEEVMFGVVLHKDAGEIISVYEPGMYFLDAIQELHPAWERRSITAWNDFPGRTQEQVLEVFDRALKLAGKED